MKFQCIHERFSLDKGLIYGGSIFNLKDANYYFVLAHMNIYQLPLNVHYYPIKNYDIPQCSNFMNIIEKAGEYIQEGHSIFVGCLSGHGRTGLFLAMLYYYLTGEKNALYIIRKLYCHKAVESVKQLNYLRSQGLHITSSDIKKAIPYGRI